MSNFHPKRRSFPKEHPRGCLLKGLFEFGTDSVNTYKDVGVIAGILVSVGANTAHRSTRPSGLATSPTVRVCGTCANVVHADRNKEIQKKTGS